MQVPEYVKNNAPAYQLKEFEAMLKHVDIRGRKVLEIGCDERLSTGRLFIANGAESVICTNLLDKFNGEEPLPEGLEFRICDVGNVEIKPSSIDVIYGIAVIEHIVDLDEVCLSLKRILKPDGIIYLQGYPLWTSPLGHHVWLRPSSDSDTPYYKFTENNPIPDWAHVVLTAEELKSVLLDQGMPAQHAERLIWQIYNTDGSLTGSCSNFRSASELLGIIHRYFDITVERNICWNQENQYYHLAREKYAEADLKTMGIRVLMKHIPPAQQAPTPSIGAE